MLCVDVNVLVYAHRAESPRHAEVRRWLDSARRAREPLGVAPLAESGFLRVVTHPRIFREPTVLQEAIAFLDAVRAGPAVESLLAGPRHREIFIELCERTAATGNRVPDAYLAAMAMENGATFVTADRGFARFPGLRWRHPLDPD
jgi:toxin-antitoxin system PIN domain toxin